MHLLACGINHQTAPLTVREKFSFDRWDASQALRSLFNISGIREAVLLSTCNRTEIYTATENKTAVWGWLKEQPKVQGIDIQPFCYHHQDMKMVRHLMRVASGLDSMVLGESQILGQMKQAFSLACEVGTVGEQLKKLFPAVFAVGKQVRQETSIGSHSISIAYAVVQLAKRLFSSLAKCRVLLMGAGEIIELVATHLHGQNVRNLIITNRTFTKAQRLAEMFSAQAIRMHEVPVHLKEADIVITAMTHALPLLGKGAIESAIRSRKHRPMLLIDLAVPRNIEQEVSRLEDIYLYNLEDVQTIIENNWKNRQAAAKQAEAIVETQAQHYFHYLHVLKAGNFIHQFRKKWEILREQELEKAFVQLQKTQDAKAALTYLARNLTNKLLHQPTVKLRQAAYEERLDLLLSAKDLFEI